MSESIYRTLTDRILLSGSRHIPELFRMAASEDEARLLLAMPGTAAELAGRVGCEASLAGERCEALYRKGLAFRSTRHGELRYRMCRDLVQFHDASILWPEAPRAFHDLWQRFMDEEWPYFARFSRAIYPRPPTRVVPIERSIDTRQRVLDADSLERIVEGAELLAVSKCTCRLTAGRCDHPLEACLQIDRGARYNLDRGTGREISRQEARAIIRDCEERGLVHLTMNTSPVGHFICNCCACCCQSFTQVIEHGTELCEPSRFCAQIDPELCTACETCLDRCHFGAIQPRTVEGHAVFHVDPERCMGCCLCEITCPSDAISLHAVRPEDFIPPARKRSGKPGGARRKPGLFQRVAPRVLPVALRAMQAADRIKGSEPVRSIRRRLDRDEPER